MTAAILSSPHWFTYPNVDPVALHVGRAGIRWYGLTYLIGALIVYLQLQSRRSRQRTGMTIEQAQEFVVYAMMGVIVGGRIFFLIADLLTPPQAGGHPMSYYLENPLELISIWHGGMAFHGGLIGAIVGSWLFLRKTGLSFSPLADEGILWLPLDIALTRCANFINGELPGRLTDAPIGIHFPDFSGYRYPSQLFEAVGMVLVVLPLLWLLHSRSRRADGIIFWAFIAAYGAVRTVVEFYREPGIVFFGLTGAQYLTIAMLILGVVMMWRCARSRPSATVPVRSAAPLNRRS
ncbi:MAG: prolipoprotein diacylglyceryl transferase [Candidatus Eremiobacteraeota bacterium]|nr:prolipoprotein diacylglyceryl transferase [Candidatus Eremiobacteraeota bacterium]MBC5826766.1 prolipoprotein diacylglyceryl transferase [Candidatus Eremiobacteraeota bacterium]